MRLTSQWRRAWKSNGAAATLAATAALAFSAPAFASDQAATSEAYEPLAPLMGEWDVGPPGSAPSFVQKFSWAPNRSYVWAKVLLLRESAEEHLHFEGMVVFNAGTKRFDYLFVVEPGSLAQERGEFRVEADGTIVRDVVLTAADGKVSDFRQTFRILGDGKIQTTLMRKAADGWTPTFPGSDNLTMVRRPGAAVS